MEDLTRLLMRIEHLFTGHPEEMCKESGALTVICICGEQIGLSDYY